MRNNGTNNAAVAPPSRRWLQYGNGDVCGWKESQRLFVAIELIKWMLSSFCLLLAGCFRYRCFLNSSYVDTYYSYVQNKWRAANPIPPRILLWCIQWYLGFGLLEWVAALNTTDIPKYLPEQQKKMLHSRQHYSTGCWDCTCTIYWQEKGLGPKNLRPTWIYHLPGTGTTTINKVVDEGCEILSNIILKMTC